MALNTKVFLLSDGYLVRFSSDEHFTVLKNDGHAIPLNEVRNDETLAEIVALRMIHSIRVE